MFDEFGEEHIPGLCNHENGAALQFEGPLEERTSKGNLMIEWVCALCGESVIIEDKNSGEN